MVRLDESLNLYQELIMEMSKKVKMMHIMALEILIDGDKNTALNIIKMDEFVNKYQEEINEKAVECLSLLAPVASDLRIVIAGIKIANDLERIADYAKNVAEYIIKNGSLDSIITDSAQDIGKNFLKMFDDAMNAYTQKDVKAAFEIPEEDQVINDTFKKMLDSIEKSIESGQKLHHIVHTIAMLRNFERAGDHTKNICEHLIYQIKGQYYDFN